MVKLMEAIPARARIHSTRELDALVAEHITGEVPEVYWEDAHAVFRFETEYEAIQAMLKLKAQLNLPKVDWDSMTVNQVKSYRPYCSDIVAAWLVIEKISTPLNPLQMHREKGFWHVAFGDHKETISRSSCIAICLAALRSAGFEVEFDQDRIN
jgi:hypothetical protein